MITHVDKSKSPNIIASMVGAATDYIYDAHRIVGEHNINDRAITKRDDNG